MNFNELLKANTRSDDYVSATGIVKGFEGKRLENYKRMPETKAYLATVGKKYNLCIAQLIETKPGKGGGTHLHPLVAIDFARYLSPDFAVFVAETFKRYLDGDVTLATEVVNRSTDLEAVEKHSEEVTLHKNYLDSYHGMGRQLAAHKCNDIHHATVNKHINNLCGVEKGKRAEMNRRQKLQMTMTQSAAELVLMDDEKSVAWDAVDVVKSVTSRVLRAAS